jgi:Glyoxalase-like domain
LSLALDHLVVASRTLEEGAAWLEARLGVAPVAGGKHAAMGTHNRLLSLGPDAYLEIIAIDPEAPVPGRPRWFALDEAAMQARLAKAPGLAHWVVRTDDIGRDRLVRGERAGEILDLERGDYRWRIGIPADGSLPEGGAFPTLIQWQGQRHPAAALPDAGCRLEWLAIRSPHAEAIEAGLDALGMRKGDWLRFARDKGTGLSAVLRGPLGMVILPELAPV